MKPVLQTPGHSVVSLTADELTGICNALNEVCNGLSIEDPEFETRLGVSRMFLLGLLAQMTTKGRCSPHPDNSRMSAWSDGESVQMICISDSGDPVDLSCDQAREFISRLQAVVASAER